MARIYFEGLQAVEQAIRTQGDSTMLQSKITRMLQAGAEVLAEGWEKELNRVIKNGTGELLGSLKTSAVLKSGDKYVGKVTATGNAKPRKMGGKQPKRKSRRGGGKQKLSNQDKAFWLENGRRGQPAKPWKSIAEAAYKDKAFSAMEQVWKE